MITAKEVERHFKMFRDLNGTLRTAAVDEPAPS